MGFDGMSPLHMASLAGHAECCRKLLQYGKCNVILTLHQSIVRPIEKGLDLTSSTATLNQSCVLYLPD